MSKFLGCTWISSSLIAYTVAAIVPSSATAGALVMRPWKRSIRSDTPAGTSGPIPAEVGGLRRRIPICQQQAFSRRAWRLPVCAVLSCTSPRRDGYRQHVSVLHFNSAYLQRWAEVRTLSRGERRLWLGRCTGASPRRGRRPEGARRQADCESGLHTDPTVSRPACAWSGRDGASRRRAPRQARTLAARLRRPPREHRVRHVRRG